MYMYPYGMPPPDQQKHFEQAVKIAERLMRREAREKERLDNFKKKDYDERYKRAKEGRARFFTSLEWFIIGVIMYPIVGPLYNAAIKYAQSY